MKKSLKIGLKKTMKIIIRVIYVYNTRTMSPPGLKSPLELPFEGIGDHLATSDARGSPKGREVQGARKGIGVSKKQHRRDPATGIFQGEARLGHLVLLDLAAAKMVNGSSRVDLGLEFSRNVSDLSAGEDVEVVICGVATGVPFSSDGSA
jgi:hypothetical protein